MKAAGQLDEALKHFTKCLEGIDTSRPFTKLPQCLREVIVKCVDYFLSCEIVSVLFMFVIAPNCKICLPILLVAFAGPSLSPTV